MTLTLLGSIDLPWLNFVGEISTAPNINEEIFMSTKGSTGNVIAAICNLFFPGLGQLVQGRLMAALIFAIICIAGYALWFLVVPAIIAGVFHLWSVIDAATYKNDSL